MPNPYVAKDLFVGRARELREACGRLAAGTSVLLIGGRQAGKSTVLNHLEDIGREVVRTDAGGWNLDEEADAIRHVGIALGVSCASRDELYCVLSDRSPLCLAVDEADRLLQRSWANDWFAWLRHLDGVTGEQALGSGICFLLTGGPVLLGFTDPKDRGSPVLNLAEKVYLRPLDLGAVGDLARRGTRQAEMPAVVDLAGGHPLLLKRAFAALEDGLTIDEAREQVSEKTAPDFEVWFRQLGPEGQAFLRTFPAEGVPTSAFSSDPAWIGRQEAMVRARYLCLLKVEGTRYLRGPRLFFDWFEARVGCGGESWDLAISYASEDEPLARTIKEHLAHHFRVFFAPDEQAYLWGRRLGEALPNVYGGDSRVVLVLSTPAYVAKHWTLTEFRAAQAAGVRALVLKMGALPPDLPDDLAYQDATSTAMIGLLDVLRKILSQA